MLQGLLFGFLLSIVGLTLDERGGDLATFVAALFIVVGVIMLAGAAKFFFQEEDDDKPPPAWLEKIESYTPKQAYSTGIGWLIVSPKQWVFVLTAVAVVFTAGLSAAASFINFLIFTLLVQTVCFLILAIHLAMPKRLGKILDALFIWLKDHFRPVVIVMFTAFGLFFLLKGLLELAG
jgi:hypothetical protein